MIFHHTVWKSSVEEKKLCIRSTIHAKDLLSINRTNIKLFYKKAHRFQIDQGRQVNFEPEKVQKNLLSEAFGFMLIPYNSARFNNIHHRYDKFIIKKDSTHIRRNKAQLQTNILAVKLTIVQQPQIKVNKYKKPDHRINIPLLRTAVARKHSLQFSSSPYTKEITCPNFRQPATS